MENDKRKNYISKETMYMEMAKLVAQRSKDPNTQVGAVVVGQNDRILTIGYNGMPNGCDDDEFPWAREADCEENTKYPYVIHAELNSILNFRGDLAALKGATIYVTLFPCHECTKALIQTGIAHLVYLSNKYELTPDHREAVRMLKAAGIDYRQYKEEN